MKFVRDRGGETAVGGAGGQGVDDGGGGGRTSEGGRGGRESKGGEGFKARSKSISELIAQQVRTCLTM